MCSVWGISIWCVTGWRDVASIITVLGILIALWQIRHQSKIAKLTFENLFVQQYQKLTQKFPTKALLGDALTDAERAEAISEFYHYIDLCNTQAYHHRKGRITRATWREWRDGIEANFQRPELALVWSYIAARRPSEFDDLRKVARPAKCESNNPYLGAAQATPAV